ncbi:helix-turn-helix domain-containing protein [Staphylococcus kloosii]|uniref:Transposase IS30-like HTH domain-containing protein n=1 Tax=Staphylococcus kloosii TaxID=29384 RepID=A0ABQ0XIL9_9STAP|nr:helix-turn-helix domain-containing protein [Staphylococcus kloosii]GEP81306.1 hypothetical protein SKL01_04840 [Staphylococcus kloosii]
MSYIHLTITERASIEILRKEIYSLRAIANRLNRSVSNVSREIKQINQNIIMLLKKLKPIMKFVKRIVDVLLN